MYIKEEKDKLKHIKSVKFNDYWNDNIVAFAKAANTTVSDAIRYWMVHGGFDCCDYREYEEKRHGC